MATSTTSKSKKVKTPPSERAAGRRKAASQGKALPDGSFPITNARQLKSAIKLRNHGNAPTAQVHAHIRKRAAALGLSHMTQGMGSNSSDGSRTATPIQKKKRKKPAPNAKASLSSQEPAAILLVSSSVYPGLDRSPKRIG